MEVTYTKTILNKKMMYSSASHKSPNALDWLLVVRMGTFGVHTERKRVK